MTYSLYKTSYSTESYRAMQHAIPSEHAELKKWGQSTENYSMALSPSMQKDLHSMIGRRFAIFAEALKAQLAASAGMSLQDYKALEYILEYDALAVGQLAQIMDLSASGVAALVQRLEQAGYIERGHHPLDKRVTALHPLMDKCLTVIEMKEQALEHSIGHLSKHSTAQITATLEFLQGYPSLSSDSIEERGLLRRHN